MEIDKQAYWTSRCFVQVKSFIHATDSVDPFIRNSVQCYSCDALGVYWNTYAEWYDT